MMIFPSDKRPKVRKILIASFNDPLKVAVDEYFLAADGAVPRIRRRSLAFGVIPLTDSM
jgi:hypothetical protein